MARSRTVFTYEDYRRLPEDGYRWELLEGHLVKEPAPRPLHQIVVVNLIHHLGTYVRQNGLGLVLDSPIDVVLSEENVVEPDVVFIPRDRWSIIIEENVRGAPALVVEVLSPHSHTRDRERKLRIYERFGVQEYWIADPEQRRLERFALGEWGYGKPVLHGAGEVFTTPLFPGLVIQVDRIFENPLAC